VVQHDEAEADTGPAGDDRHLARRGPRAFREVTLGRPSTAGLVVGAVFWLASLGPTLLPRAWMFQAAISALSFLVGYGLGVLGALILAAWSRRLTLSMLREAVEANARTRFDRAHFKEFGDSALVFEVVYFVLDPDFNTYMDIQQAIKTAEATLNGSGRVLVRYSGTEALLRIMVEGERDSTIREVADHLANIVRARIG